MKHWHIRLKIATMVGVFLFTLLAVAVLAIDRLSLVRNQLKETAMVTGRKILLTNDLRSNFLIDVRNTKNALITDDDEAIAEYATQAASSRQEVERLREQLGVSIAAANDPTETAAFEDFSAAWKEHEQIERQVVAFAIRNTDTKGRALCLGEIDERMNECRDALKVILERAGQRLAAGDVAPADQARLLNRQVLAYRGLANIEESQFALLRHTDSGSVDEMTRLEAVLRRLKGDFDGLVADLSATLDVDDRPLYETIVESMKDARKLTATAVALSEENTKLRARELSTNQSREVGDRCMAALGRLLKILDDDLQTQTTVAGEVYIQATWSIIAGTVLGLVVSFILAWYVTRVIVEPVRRSVKLTQALAEGDLTSRLEINQRDEIGQLAASIDEVSRRLSDIVTDVKEDARQIATSAHEMTDVSHQLLAQSEQTATQATNVAAATEQLSSNVTSIAASAEEMSVNFASISAATEELSANVGSVSSAAQQTAAAVDAVSKAIAEMSQELESVAEQATSDSEVAARALATADSAKTTIHLLRESAADITKVTDTIRMIALQTNLLALNATIEATSAGEAGRGFAVVAHEIKELANQSGKAAEGIATKLEGVQSSTAEAVEMIQAVAKLAEEIHLSSRRSASSICAQNDVAGTITGTVLDANKSVAEIARGIAEVAKGSNDVSSNVGEASRGASAVSKNVGEAAKASTNISDNIHGINTAAQLTNQSARRVNEAAKVLIKVAAELQRLVSQFRTTDHHA